MGAPWAMAICTGEYPPADPAQTRKRSAGFRAANRRQRIAVPSLKTAGANLLYMRAFAQAWPQEEAIVQQAVGQLPWGHNLLLLAKLKDPHMRMSYAQRAIEHGWSRNVLGVHIERLCTR